HERQLHDGRQAGLEEPFEGGVTLLEVVNGTTVDLAVHPEAVVEDRVGPDGAGPELRAGDPERLREVVADVPAAGALPAQEEGEVLGPDDRAPWAGCRPQLVGDVNGQVDRGVAGLGAAGGRGCR